MLNPGDLELEQGATSKERFRALGAEFRDAARLLRTRGGFAAGKRRNFVFAAPTRGSSFPLKVRRRSSRKKGPRPPPRRSSPSRERDAVEIDRVTFLAVPRF